MRHFVHTTLNDESAPTGTDHWVVIQLPEGTRGMFPVPVLRPVCP